MSAVKRKHDSTSKGRDSSKKRQRVSPEPTQKKSTSKQENAPTTTKSVLSKEQTAFPRGGAGPLTLIEQKQIRAKATRDVAREAEAGDLFNGQATGASDSEDSDLDLEDIEEKQTFAKKKSKKQKKSKSAKSTDSIPIESVSYKKLTDGSLLLGRVSSVSRRGLTICLPNNLSGFVPLTAISQQFNSAIEKALQETSEDEDADEEDEQDIDVRQLFRSGQTLRVAVQELADEDDGRKDTKKRINLSLEPARVNAGLQKNLLAPGVTVQAAVVSIEDHGAVVDIGLGDNVVAFLPEKALPSGLALSSLKTGAVLLCTVTSSSSKGKAVQLSADLASAKQVKAASSVDAYLPGTLAEVLLTQVNQDGLAGKLLGVLDITADALHSTSSFTQQPLSEKYQIGQKIIARLIANFGTSDKKKLAFSVVDTVVNIPAGDEHPLPISSIVDRAKIISVAHGLGVYFSLPAGALGFAHISRLADKNIDSLSETVGPYKIGTEHQARILEHNSVDGLYILSLQQSVIDQPFLRLEDVQAGAVAKGTIEKVLVGENGVRGILIKIASGITGFVSTLHLSDVALTHPERKFREGMAVKARVLSVDPDRRRLELTLKKSLVNSDQPTWNNWDSLEVGQSTIGTIVKVEANGAILQFYGSVKGRLPVAEMSEAFIKDARDHFKVGQVMTVHILRLDPEKRRLTLTARDPTATRNDISTVIAGSLVSGTVFEKSSDDVLLRLEPNGAIARLPLDHFSDGSENKRKSALEKTRVGQKLESVLVLEVKGRQITLSNKPSLRKAASEGKLIKSFEQVKEGEVVTGFVSNITEQRIFVRFAQGITGVINKGSVPDDQADSADFGMKVLQPVSARIVEIDYKGAIPRFWLSMKADSIARKDVAATPATAPIPREVMDPVDDSIHSYEDLAAGKNIRVRITSIKETQLNVYIAKDIQGRVDVSEVYDKIEDIHDRKAPLRQFSSKQVIEVKILGQHDSRSYKFLPLSHRTSKNVVFELSARPSTVSGERPAVLKLADLKVGESYMAFVNNITDHALMVNISPAVRGRIRDRDVADDISMAANLPRNFPIGSALLAKVLSVDVEKNHLDLSAKSGGASKLLTIENVSAGDIVAGRITKCTDRSVVVQLSENLVGVAEMIDLTDDYDLADPARFQKGEIVRAYVLQVDQPNKKIYLSLRSSKILSSSLETKDPELSLETVNVGDVRRGFISNVSEKGVFVTLARGLTAFVRVTNLSDAYLKDWRDQFQKDQLVQGKITLVDKDSGHVQMSLRQSHVDGNYQPPTTFHDLNVGDIVEGKIAKIETFGVFIVVDKSENVRGLCHRSEIAEKRIADVKTLGFSEGDAVKAVVLKIEPDQRRVNFGMKASYFDKDDDDEDVDMGEADSVDDTDDSDAGVQLVENDGEESSDDENLDGISIDLNAIIAPDSDEKEPKPRTAPQGLSVGGFDWYGMPSTTTLSSKRPAADISDEEPSSTSANKPKKKKKKATPFTDRTADIDTAGPQSTDDFDRLLLSDPDNAQLWIQLMAFHLDLGDTDAARATASRALSSIGMANESAKRAIWVALLNIETTFGDADSVDATLQRACETMDAEDMHARLASIYIQSGTLEKADALFQTMTRKFTQNPKLWVNYATFLFDNLEQPTKARALLPRALQALPPFTHLDVTKQFAVLEFKTKSGVAEEGRTRFQGLINLYPKRLDLFNVLLDQEIRLGDVEQVRGVFEQVLAKKDLKPAKVKPFFSRWLKFEEERGHTEMVEKVKQRAAGWVREFEFRK